MRTQGRQPRILLTNVKQLELLLTRQVDVELFKDARLDFLVFDEAHTFSGAQGAEAACLIRRLRAFCGRKEQDTVCVATSATIVDKDYPDAARDFAARFFGVPKEEVVTVGEAYEPEAWTSSRIVPPEPSRDPAGILNECVSAVEDASGEAVRSVYRELAGSDLAGEDWQAALHEGLSQNEILFQLSESLAAPRTFHELPPELEKTIGRPVSEAEILCWLTLGAAAQVHGRPLLRPVVHGFIRGISGAVVSFPKNRQGPRLWLAAEDEIEAGEGDEKHAHFPVATCTTCGQHYFISFLKDFEFSGKAPGGGEAAGDSFFWEPLAETEGGRRVVLLGHLVGGSDDEDLEDHARTATLYFCRHCGAAHPREVGRCLHCGAAGETITLYAVRQQEGKPGVLTSCLSCGTNGRRIGSQYREPARPVRATTVADVHVLAQDMVHNSDRQRLLVFCDNRQDAAFQAGWMKDHARRFRLWALMAEALKKGPQSVGDLARNIDDVLEEDDALSRALVPEVWEVVLKEGSGGRHQQERRKFLRIQVLREVTLPPRQSIGLEPWGRMKVEYEGLDASLSWIQENARRLAMPAEDLRDGVAGLLDYLRRKRVLYDPEREVFTKYWMEGDLEVQQGYMPQIGNPVGTKLRREPTEKKELVTQWISDRGDTTIRQIARKWRVEPDETEAFLESLFNFLLEQGLLTPVRLKGSRGKPLPNISGVYQVNGARLRLQQNHGVWRCKNCRRRITRRTPWQVCLAWRCNGELEFVREDPDNYDLQLLDQGYSMLRPEEHTAMVPHDERERLENLFKGGGDAVNTFVCTPTLELGVDIGKLDAVMMRNVPPLPANYWQRAGRAGRRHRMAVIMTYCRPVSHDRAYFNDPVKLLAGRVDPPAFNLRNDVMVAKHVHATVITRLHQYTRDSSRSDEERRRIEEVLTECLPSRVSAYLFEGGFVRENAFDLSPLKELVESNLQDLRDYVSSAFRQGWPELDAEVTKPEALQGHISGMVAGLDEVVSRLTRRLRLVNVGATNAIERSGRFGYPICKVCGQSVSPLSSDKQLEHFEKSHQERCGRAVTPVGFYADVVADVLSLPECPDQITAYSVLEALRLAATHVLDMHMEDLQILVIGHVDRDEVDALLWDPMPGGSGLLEQVYGRFDEITRIALEIVEKCSSVCEKSCIDCLQTFRNSYYHKHLNRMVAQECLEAWGTHLVLSHQIPPKQPSKEPGEGAYPVNEAERKLRHLLLSAGFEEGIRGKQIRLDRAIGTTMPDVIYRADYHEENEGICIYLDGLSGHLHGNPQTAEQDRRIRTWLGNNEYDVIEIAVSDLDDEEAMTRHFRKLASYLRKDQLRKSLAKDTSWFRLAKEKKGERERRGLRLVRPSQEEKYVNCVPLVPLRLAAGAFKDPQSHGTEDWDWVEIDTHRRLRPGMFVAQVVGKSMEPFIPDGSYCLFSAPVPGTRQGKIVLVESDDPLDPETGSRYTVKRYESEKVTSEDGTWRHIKITLKPINPDFQPIELTCEEEGRVRVVAELLEVLE
ncbi:MAG: DUF1998 domain-containing protein [Deltaproteobacteria bacterium]|nr:DUF1998 domain-containing protein [Deltaproteobacteria bacterium]